ncbi:MAG: Ppx/GppA family phosphatase [Myxococcales bacterium]|jgi:exopolyphosphatase/guanosine-5'-triphosphate,3'-diphosphate pyrophosphatase|nr:Ppx/GppA family phosphatase [Myxococcales bacterium]
MPRFAAIDIGSNAMRLRIVEASAPGAVDQLSLLPDRDSSGWREVLSLRAPVRLGAEVFVTGRIASSALGQACAALKQFREAMDAAKVDAYRATATSAVREAENSAVLVERARREAGVELDVIEGVEEARLIRLAVMRRAGLADRRALLVDVGGGSTEVTYLDRGQSSFSMSMPVGTVRLLETYLRGDGAVDREKRRLLVESVDRAFVEVKPHAKRWDPELVVATGGNSETLADLCPFVGGYAGHARAIDARALPAMLERLCDLSVAERRDTFGLRPDRADTVVPAAAIYGRAAALARIPAIVVPGVGLKEGILEELVAKHFDLWDTQGEEEGVVEACVRLGARYKFDEAHGRHVARLSAVIFDALGPLHGYGRRERLLLRAAAVLHDIGDFVRYDGHHKHSYYLIQHSDVMGLSPDERALVANVARYHRKSPPDVAHPNFRELDKDARAKVRALAAILRIGDALDREHLGKVTDIEPVLDRGRRRLVLTLVGDDARELEEWTVRAKSALLTDVFDLDLALAAGDRGGKERASTRPKV